ncbi:MAG: anthranilate phosphoribosyltransferase [Candidatus Omnitrophota bacterium]
MIQEGLHQVVNGKNLSQTTMEKIFTEIMQGKATSAQIAAFITALRIKGETIEEITGAAFVMRKFAIKINIADSVVLDTCGTGGSGKHVFNVSTLSALICAACGVKVAKHGNRSVSSKSGSADLLEKLGVNISAAPQIMEKCINDINIGFLFAPCFHTAMKYALGPRKEIGIRTIFNVLGPLTNPAQATCQLLGVFKPDLVEPLANVLKNLKLNHALVVSGQDGLDEISTYTATLICELKDNQLRTYTVEPEDFNLERAELKDIQINDVETSVKITHDLLQGKIQGPIADIVILNAGFSLYAAEKVDSVIAGMELSRKALLQGKVKEKLNLLIKNTNAVNS